MRLTLFTILLAIHLPKLRNAALLAEAHPRECFRSHASGAPPNSHFDSYGSKLSLGIPVTSSSSVSLVFGCSHFSPHVIFACSWEPQLPILPPVSRCGCCRHHSTRTVRCLCVIPFWSSFPIIFLNQVASTISEQTIASQGCIRRRIDKILVHVGQLSSEPMKWSSHSPHPGILAPLQSAVSHSVAILHCALLLFSESCCCRATVVTNSNPLLCTSCIACCSGLVFGILSPCSFRLVSDRAATLSYELVPVSRLHFSLDRFSLHALSFLLTDRPCF